MESMKHLYAKNKAIKILRDSPINAGFDCARPLVNGDFEASCTVYLQPYSEYPLCFGSSGEIIGIQPHWLDLIGRIPAYKECVAGGLLPFLIFDIGLLFFSGTSNAHLHAAIEVEYKNPVSAEKLAYLPQIMKGGKFGALCICTADTVLRHGLLYSKRYFSDGKGGFYAA